MTETPNLPDGPFYRCHTQNMVGWCIGGIGLKSRMHHPTRLRWLKGKWLCWNCFYFGFGRDVLHQWETATTLAQYLEDQDG